MPDFIVAGHLDGDDVIVRKVAAKGLAEAKTALRNLLLESVVDSIEEAEGSAENVDFPAVYLDFAAPADQVPEIDASQYGSLDSDEDDDTPMVA